MTKELCCMLRRSLTQKRGLGPEGGGPKGGAAAAGRGGVGRCTQNLCISENPKKSRMEFCMRGRLV